MDSLLCRGAGAWLGDRRDPCPPPSSLLLTAGPGWAGVQEVRAGQLSPPGAGRRRARATSTRALGAGGRGDPPHLDKHTPHLPHACRPHPSGSPQRLPSDRAEAVATGLDRIRWDGGGWGYAASVPSVTSGQGYGPETGPPVVPPQPGEGTVTFDLRSAPPLRPMAPGLPLALRLVL